VAHMNRRMFTFTSAGALAMTTTGAVAAKSRRARRGEQVVLSGWLTSASSGASHYYVLGGDPFVSDPPSDHPAQWPRDLTLVLPADTRTMQTGKVSLQGRLYRGPFKDVSTGRAATAVMVGATLV
jgi:hypothetical protein